MDTLLKLYIQLMLSLPLCLLLYVIALNSGNICIGYCEWILILVTMIVYVQL